MSKETLTIAQPLDRESVLGGAALGSVIDTASLEKLLQTPQTTVEPQSFAGVPSEFNSLVGTQEFDSIIGTGSEFSSLVGTGEFQSIVGSEVI